MLLCIVQRCGGLARATHRLDSVEVRLVALQYLIDTFHEWPDIIEFAASRRWHQAQSPSRYQHSPFVLQSKRAQRSVHQPVAYFLNHIDFPDIAQRNDACCKTTPLPPNNPFVQLEEGMRIDVAHNRSVVAK